MNIFSTIVLAALGGLTVVGLVGLWLAIRADEARVDRRIARERAAAEAEVADAIALDRAEFDAIVRHLDEMPEWGDAA
ncbi:hypothetical protein [Streptomyces sp. NRRL F-5630]|uniref:hypothetical protein n=1 Tax=Streptomyces sp. NRRL F-5630 TaxID=1463864 RepID=UPI003EB91344